VHFLDWIINFHSQLQGWSYLLLFTMVTTDTINNIASQETATKLVLMSKGNYSAFGNVVPVHHTTKMEVISPRMLNSGTCRRCATSYPIALYTRRRRNKPHALAQNQTPVVFCPPTSLYWATATRAVKLLSGTRKRRTFEIQWIKSIMVLCFTVRDMSVHCYSYPSWSI